MGGDGHLQKLLIIFIGTFFQQVLLLMDNVKSVPRDFINLGRTLQMPEWRILQRIVLPSALPAIWDSMRISLGWAWTWLVVAELVAATSGLGYRITTAQRYFQTDLIFGYLLILGILGLATDQVMKYASRRCSGTSMPAEKLLISGLGKTFRSERGVTVALEGVDLAIGENEFVALVGTSGCGKSTLLSIAAGLDSQDEGSIAIDGEPIVAPGLDRGVVFQSYTLLPWLTTLENVEFALKAAGKTAREAREIAQAHLELVGLQGFEKAFPSELSGGMKQRVAIARALSYRPKMLLMDEPFGALDALTRHHMQELLTGIWEKHRLTVLFITHDVEEAVYLSDRVAVMTNRPGRIKTVVDIDLPRPRHYEMVASPEFQRLHRAVLDAIRSELLVAAALQAPWHEPGGIRTSDATALVALIWTGEVGREEVLAPPAARIAACNPAVNAVIELFDRPVEDDVPDAPFAGVPFLLKDIGAGIAGTRTSAASRARDGAAVQDRDDALTARFRRAGLRILGKTNLPDSVST